eukprot:scaffold193889_cov30-Tisochrysis_lutea.AAC.3
MKGNSAGNRSRVGLASPQNARAREAVSDGPSASSTATRLGVVHHGAALVENYGALVLSRREMRRRRTNAESPPGQARSMADGTRRFRKKKTSPTSGPQTLPRGLP